MTGIRPERLLTGMDGVTGLTLFTIPFAGGIFAEQFLNSRQKLWSTRTVVTAYRVLVFSIMAVIGIIINELLLGKLVAGYQDANTEFSEMSTWADHVRDLPIAWMKLLGVKNLPDVMFTEEVLRLSYFIKTGNHQEFRPTHHCKGGLQLSGRRSSQAPREQS